MKIKEEKNKLVDHAVRNPYQLLTDIREKQG